ncbi:hypothetical protein LKI_01755 [Leuconostoc kimchii IMSNU 11154]|uniref:Uncharacterized protein n=1 Tax=Leuconostoc kimchii (strain IMSNU 11154 / KCTC 2386 / IH25) TaxID=762051 RepID=D5T0U5_LEUKI|nr:phage tail tube assembly chaperone [Leuconostoc kimchii]ADG39894.1 hypothetical protein LKI_01755 [Leuconostoc kimchii IMSNU 11154]
MAVNTEKIKLNKFGIRKTVGVRLTFGLFEKLEETEIEIDELQDEEDLSELEAKKNRIKSTKIMVDLIQNVFDLSDEEIAKIKDSIDPTQFGEAYWYVTMRMRGMSDSDYNLAVLEQKRKAEEEAEDPKAEPVESED